MQLHILNVLEEYILKHNLNNDTVIDKIKDITYPVFFNELTVSFLGLPTYTHDDRNTKTTNSIVYLVDTLGDKLAPNLSEISIDNMFLSTIQSHDIKFNYPNFKELIKILLDTRKDLKQQLVVGFGEDDKINTTQMLIKYYLNMVYGMIDNPLSVLSTELNNPREFIVNRAKNIVLTIVEFLIKNELPVIYIDTDTVYSTTISNELKNELLSYLKETFSSVMDVKYLNLSFDNNLTGYFIGRKKFIIGKNIKTRGLEYISDIDALKVNKRYFGENYPNMFPEYSF